MTGALEVLHCDNHVLAVCKPAGLPVVPDASGDESLLDRARAWVEREFEKPGRAFLGVVHRLDRPVSGVVVFGRTSKGAARLTDQFRRRAVRKVYWGLVEGHPRGVAAGAPSAERESVLWLAKDRARNVVRVHRRPVEGALEARTTWRVLAAGRSGSRDVAWLELVPHTGRSHQLRATAAELGCPLLGDVKYGASAPLPGRVVALHAARLELRHPTRDEHLELVCEAPVRPWRQVLEDLS